MASAAIFLAQGLPQLLSTVQDSSAALVTRESAVLLYEVTRSYTQGSSDHSNGCVCMYASSTHTQQVTECVADGALAARDWSVVQSRSQSRTIQDHLERDLANKDRAACFSHEHNNLPTTRTPTKLRSRINELLDASATMADEEQFRELVHNCCQVNPIRLRQRLE